MRIIDYQETENNIMAFWRYDDTLYRDYFKMHNHENGYEILYFIQGNAKYRVEGREKNSGRVWDLFWYLPDAR